MMPQKNPFAPSRREVLVGGAVFVGLSSLSMRAIATATPSHRTNRQGARDMSTITTTDGVEIFYKDWGTGQPIVFSHGWPLSADDWDAQMLFFLQHGYRVIAH